MKMSVVRKKERKKERCFSSSEEEFVCVCVLGLVRMLSGFRPYLCIRHVVMTGICVQTIGENKKTGKVN